MNDTVDVETDDREPGAQDQVAGEWGAHSLVILVIGIERPSYLIQIIPGFIENLQDFLSFLKSTSFYNRNLAAQCLKIVKIWAKERNNAVITKL